ncbi:hypothetical protein NDN08_007873 [Rhodosorus marinus]|uniref:RING-type domain-containing protein n=1 Tax=Rhodosorus marinus TaxID=101924 RepID=A0AAV8V1K7_9RHOD|nr:hypothetical protein NDN08_007873 [Rhodosorus marinus]
MGAKDEDSESLDTRWAVDSSLWVQPDAKFETDPLRRVAPLHMCFVCLERESDIVLDPCGHKMCSTCVTNLLVPGCPQCRVNIDAVKYPTESFIRSFQAIRAEQLIREERALEATVQVLIIGVSSVGKKTLMKKMLEVFPVSPLERDKFYTYSGKTVGNSDALGKFSPNALVKNTAVRFRCFTLPPYNLGSANKRFILETIDDMRPDILVLAASCHRRDTLVHCSHWDRLFQQRFSDRFRIWCLLKHPGHEFLTETVEQNDVYTALNGTAIENYPRGIFVANPKAFLLGRWGVKQIAYAAVKFGRRVKRMENPVAPPGQTGLGRFFRWMDRSDLIV